MKFLSILSVFFLISACSSKLEIKLDSVENGCSVRVAGQWCDPLSIKAQTLNLDHM